MQQSSQKSEGHYDARVVKVAQSRQLNSLNGSRRYAPTHAYLAAQKHAAAAAGSSTPSQNLSSSSQYFGGEEDFDFSPNSSSNWDESRRDYGGTNTPNTDRPTGLRHFSTKVCEKVKQKGLTNYNEVADELVAEYFENNMMKQVDVVKQEYDMKNIRRRVYDALNVLLAMNIITKNKKDIRWLGLPASSAQEITRLEEEKTRREQSIKSKLESLQEMIVQLVAYKNLVANNREKEKLYGRPDSSTLLYLPFLIINTHRETMVDCSVSSDKSEYLFSFDKAFEIHDDLEVLKKMKSACGLDTGSSTDEEVAKAKSYLPPLIRPYIDDILSGHKRLMQEKAERRLRYLEEEAEGRADGPTSTIKSEVRSKAVEEASSHREMDTDHVDVKDVELTRGLPQQRLYQPNRSPQKMVRVNLANTVPQGQPTTTRRYFVQKTPQGTIRREIAPQPIRQVSRPYPVATSTVPQLPQRVTGGGGVVGQPVKYYVAQGQPGQPAVKYMTKVGTRPLPPIVAAKQQIVYGPQGQRMVATQRLAPGQAPPHGTVIRKVIKRVIVPKVQGHQTQMVKRIVHGDPNTEQTKPMQYEHEETEMKMNMDLPMSSRQSEQLIQQQQSTRVDHQQSQVQQPQQQDQYDDFLDEQFMDDEFIE